MHEALLAPAEEPGLWTPQGEGTRLVAGGGFTLVVRHERATVEGIRLGAGAVPAAVIRARSLARESGMGDLVWWVGELSEPPGLAGALAAEGLVPFEEEPLLVTLTTERAPERVGGVEVRRVEDLAGFRRAREVDWEAWDIPEASRERRRLSAEADWERIRSGGSIDIHLALVDGRPAGFSRLVHLPAAGVLMGGAVAPWARGRGAYRALVRARWDASAARGVPRLVTSAGAMSRPVLEGLGFRRIGEVRLLRDPLP
ncbi:MAG: GNAT family N-acetyltransferase [Thermoleophilia bacterium]|nr:GNAT family N-acetyltransferase [Thermoleophilia bacterium]